MAHGYLQHFAGSRAAVYSAGVEVHGLNPKAVEIMQQDGIDISQHTSNHVDEYADISFQYIITVCDHANERCPVFPSTAKRFHHNFTDPSKVTGTPQQIEEAFRQTRNQIKEYCRKWVTENILP